jgi:SpoVK/Ycf46/Vps4 family AAA+-type ATPase
MTRKTRKKRKTPKNIEKYASDLEAMEQELSWVEARARRIAAERRLADLLSEEEPSHWSRQEPVTPGQARSRVRRYSAQEAQCKEVAIQRAAVSHSMLDRVCADYGLNDRERTLLVLAAAPAFSKRFETLYGPLCSDGMNSSTLNVEVYFNFLELSLTERIEVRSMFRKDAPLVANDLVVVGLHDRYSEPEQLLDASLSLTWRTFQMLVGDAIPQDEMLDFSSLEMPRASFGQLVLPDKEKERILSVVEGHENYLEKRKLWGFDDVIRYGRGAVLLFHGAPGTGKTMAAHAIADHLGKRVLNVDIPTFIDHREQDRYLPALFREARLQDAVLFFDECEALFGSRSLGNTLMNLLLTEIERFEGIAVLATNLAETLDPALERRILVRVAFPKPDREARAEIWSKLLPETAPLASDVDPDELGAKFEITGGYIKNAVLMAVARVARDGRDRLSQADFLAAGADQQIRVSDSDGERLVIPKARLADVVLEIGVKEEVEELIDASRDRNRVLEKWGIGTHISYGRGVVALLHGPPGTGKTLCAEAIAGELARPLLSCALPAVLSRWVGGTERNLEAVFERATRQNAVVFLDEADAWIGSRKGMAAEHDHRLVNLLLTLIERHEGVVLLATNFAATLDDALARRVGWSLHLDAPDAVRRAEIWRRLLPATAPGAADVDIGRLATSHELTGAQIKNAVFRAAFRAARGGGILTTEGLHQAARREVGSSVIMLGLAVGDA